ncbi:uncharacterized protein LOC128136629 [Harpia harpyja]|uniref:uncharacterized protein LOC128136629 n=1 Tax=Harpia harpyja TaxID=202280 RepID=UPI0022B15724|nr:uncharacterized protein LOC128136629 [Harpia harpyja]
MPKATKSHPCPCCFAGSFCDASDVLGADLLDCSYSMPDRQLVRRVASQVEFHLSDENLAKDAFLLKHVQKNKMGFVSIKLLTSLKKVEYLTHDWWLTLYALQFSELLEVNEEGTKVRRWVIAYVHTFCMVCLHCALVQYKSLGSASALRSLEDLSRQSCPRGESIRVVRLCGKGSEKTPGAEREVADELVDQPGWKAQAVAVTFPDGLGDSLLCSSPELNGAQALPPLLLHKDPSAPSWPGSNFKPSNFGNAFTGLLLASKVFPLLGTGLGTGSCYGLCSSTESTRGCGWGSGVGAWAPWPSSPSPDAKPLAGNPPAATWVPEPLGLRDAVLCLPHCCPKSGVVYPGVQNANRDTEQKYFIPIYVYAKMGARWDLRSRVAAPDSSKEAIQGNCLLRDQPKPPPSYLSESSDLCFWYRRSQLPASGSSKLKLCQGGPLAREPRPPSPFEKGESHLTPAGLGPCRPPHYRKTQKSGLGVARPLGRDLPLRSAPLRAGPAPGQLASAPDCRLQ